MRDDRIRELLRFALLIALCLVGLVLVSCETFAAVSEPAAAVAREFLPRVVAALDSAAAWWLGVSGGVVAAGGAVIAVHRRYARRRRADERRQRRSETPSDATAVGLAGKACDRVWSKRRRRRR